MKKQVKELTEGMQRLCAVANRIVAQDGRVDRIEVDLLLEDLRRLYDVALQLGGDALPKAPAVEVEEEPVKDEEHMMAMMSTMAAMTTVGEEEKKAEAEPEPEPVEAVPAEKVDEVEAASETVAPEPEPVPEPLPPMEELEQNDNGLLFDEIIIEPEVPEAPAPAVVETKEEPVAEAPAAAPERPQQASLLDYLSVPVQRTLGESLGEGRGQQHPLEKKVDDLRTVININDKFSFMSELFHNNMKAYNDFIMRLNATDSRDEALAHVQDIAAQYKWDEASATVASFYKIFDKKF
ncbi:MAG: hypothetical protein K6E96_05645 [Bacteroidales bacterium]|nr:hypothetical protein [Bacteroidales bacterium]